MTPRRDGSGGGFNPDRFAARMEESDAALRARMEALFDNMNERLDRIDREGAKGERDRSSMASELGELRTLIGEGREATALLADQMAKHIGEAEGAAREAKGAADGATKAANASAQNTATLLERIARAAPWQKGTVWALGVMVIGFFIDKGPQIVRTLNAFAAGVSAFWAGIGK